MMNERYAVSSACLTFVARKNSTPCSNKVERPEGASRALQQFHRLSLFIED
jgi:hypothetical protein